MVNVTHYGGKDWTVFNVRRPRTVCGPMSKGLN